MSFRSLTSDEVDAFTETANKIAEEVAKNSLRCNSNRINIIGSRAPEGERKRGYMIEDGENRTLVSDSNKTSFILNGLVGVNLEINGKINHVLIRDCHRSTISLPHGVISGISLLKSRNVIASVPTQNTTSLEETLETWINGQITPDTVIYVSSSCDITINQQSLHVHPFTRGTFRGGRFFPTGYSPVDLNMINHSQTQVVQIQINST